MVCKDKENNLQTTLCRKPTDQQSYLHAKSEHPRALKNRITYSQTLRLETLCSTKDEYQKNSAVMKTKHNEDNLDKQMETVDSIERKQILQNNEKIKSKKNIPLVLIYNRNLPNISELVRKN